MHNPTPSCGAPNQKHWTVGQVSNSSSNYPQKDNRSRGMTITFLHISLAGLPSPFRRFFTGLQRLQEIFYRFCTTFAWFYRFHHTQLLAWGGRVPIGWSNMNMIWNLSSHCGIMNEESDLLVWTLGHGHTPVRE